LEKGELVLEKLHAPGKEGRCEIRLIASPLPATREPTGAISASVLSDSNVLRRHFRSSESFLSWPPKRSVAQNTSTKYGISF
jgi:hypothetical protein